MKCIYEKIKIETDDINSAINIAQFLKTNFALNLPDNADIIFAIKENKFFFENEGESIFKEPNGDYQILKFAFDFIEANIKTGFSILYLISWDSIQDSVYLRLTYNKKDLIVDTVNLLDVIGEEECPNCGASIDISKIEYGKTYSCPICDETIEYQMYRHVCSKLQTEWLIKPNSEGLIYTPNKSKQ